MYVGSCIHCFVVLRRFSAEEFQDKKFCLQCCVLRHRFKALSQVHENAYAQLKTLPWTSLTVSVILLAPRRDQSRRSRTISDSRQLLRHKTWNLGVLKIDARKPFLRSTRLTSHLVPLSVKYRCCLYSEHPCAVRNSILLLVADTARIYL